jgi:hypothetical protein
MYQIIKGLYINRLKALPTQFSPMYNPSDKTFSFQNHNITTNQSLHPTIPNHCKVILISHSTEAAKDNDLTFYNLLRRSKTKNRKLQIVVFVIYVLMKVNTCAPYGHSRLRITIKLLIGPNVRSRINYRLNADLGLWVLQLVINIGKPTVAAET